MMVEISSGPVSAVTVTSEVIDAIIAFDESNSKLAEAKDWATVADNETAYWFDGPGQPADRADPATRAMVREWIYSNYAAEIESGNPQPLEPSADTKLDRLTMPVLAVVGDRDEAYALASMKHLAEAVPNGRFQWGGRRLDKTPLNQQRRSGGAGNQIGHIQRWRRFAARGQSRRLAVGRAV